MTAAAPPRAILFDLDCTLTDREASIRTYAGAFEAYFETGVAREKIERVLINADGLGYRAADRPRDIAAAFGKRFTPEDADAHWRSLFPNCTVAVPRLEPVLDALAARDVRVGLITNGGSAQRRKLDWLGIADRFFPIVISDELGVKKPDIRIFEHALAELDLGAPPAASDVWFVGDHPANDVGGASAAGLRPFWVAGVHAWPGDLIVEHTRLDALDELLDHVA